MPKPPRPTTPSPPPGPDGPGQWTIQQITQALSRKLPQELLKSKVLKGKKITFIPWYKIPPILEKYAPGWEWSITAIVEVGGDRLILTGALTIPTAHGPVTRSATGTELLKRVNDEGEIVEIAYGDPASNAEASAFVRACSKFGLGLYLKE